MEELRTQIKRMARGPDRDEAEQGFKRRAFYIKAGHLGPRKMLADKLREDGLEVEADHIAKFCDRIMSLKAKEGEEEPGKFSHFVALIPAVRAPSRSSSCRRSGNSAQRSACLTRMSKVPSSRGIHRGLHLPRVGRRLGDGEDQKALR